MIGNQIIQTSIDELKAITKIDLCVAEIDGEIIASTSEVKTVTAISVRSFIDSSADSQVIGENHFFRVLDDKETAYVLVTKGDGEESNTIGRIAVSQIQNLIIAYKERFDDNNFFQNLIMDNLLLVDIYNRAKKLRIPIEQRRAVFLMEVASDNDTTSMAMLKGLFSPKNGDYVTAVDEKNLIVVKSLSDDEGYKELEMTAKTIVDMMNSEAMVKVHVSYGTIVNDLKEVSRSYKEAHMALDVGKIFYSDKLVNAYNTLGIGRLIYQLPTSLCKIFIQEVFGKETPEDFDEETHITIKKFFENSLNVSETSRQLYIHRNTLVYRIEKIQKKTGLDIRVFEDALTLRIALMVQSYMKYLEEKDLF